MKIIGKCDIGDIGAVAMADALTMNKSLNVLNVCIFVFTIVKNNIGNIGAIAMAEALKINRVLAIINMSNIHLNV